MTNLSPHGLQKGGGGGGGGGGKEEIKGVLRLCVSLNRNTLQLSSLLILILPNVQEENVRGDMMRSDI